MPGWFVGCYATYMKSRRWLDYFNFDAGAMKWFPESWDDNQRSPQSEGTRSSPNVTARRCDGHVTNRHRQVDQIFHQPSTSVMHYFRKSKAPADITAPTSTPPSELVKKRDSGALATLSGGKRHMVQPGWLWRLPRNLPICSFH
jgi:hypothetical protein